MHVSAQLDYALRALIELAKASGDTVTRQDLARAQGTVADVAELLDGSLIDVHGMEPEAVAYRRSAENVRTVWQGVRSQVRVLLEGVTLADLAAGSSP